MSNKNMEMKNENGKNMLGSRITALWLVSLFVMSGLVVMVGAEKNSEKLAGSEPQQAVGR